MKKCSIVMQYNEFEKRNYFNWTVAQASRFNKSSHILEKSKWHQIQMLIIQCLDKTKHPYPQFPAPANVPTFV